MIDGNWNTQQHNVHGSYIRVNVNGNPFRWTINVKLTERSEETIFVYLILAENVESYESYVRFGILRLVCVCSPRS